MADCLFCAIVAGDVPADIVRTDERTVAFRDINPQAPVHVLIVPREHIVSIADCKQNNCELMGHLLWAAAEIARDKGLAKGYRAVLNTGADGGQTVDHLHVHLLGGRSLTWPPG